MRRNLNWKKSNGETNRDEKLELEKGKKRNR